MPYCPNCGNHYYEGTKICECGQLLGKQDVETAAKSTPKSKFHLEKPCRFCHTIGKIEEPIDGKFSITCPVCGGRRYNLIPEDWVPCGECLGSGEFAHGSGAAIVRKPCLECKGIGWKAGQQ